MSLNANFPLPPQCKSNVINAFFIILKKLHPKVRFIVISYYSDIPLFPYTLTYIIIIINCIYSQKLYHIITKLNKTN